MGAPFRHPVVPLDDPRFIAWTRQHGVTLWAAAADGIPLHRALPLAGAGKGEAGRAVEGPIAVIVGNEGAGIRPQLNAVAAKRVAIPLAHGAESLNVAVAAVGLPYEVLACRSPQSSVRRPGPGAVSRPRSPCVPSPAAPRAVASLSPP